MSGLRAPLTDWRRGDEGQAIVLVAIVSIVLLMFVGIAIDAGQVFNGRRTAQEAADAAAFAGAVVLYQGGSPVQAVAAATLDATKNGYTAGALTTVTVNTPPTSGAYQGNAQHVEVIISDQVRTSLVPAQAGLTLVRVRGVAGAEAVSNGGYAIIVLDQSPTSGTLDTLLGQTRGELHVSGGGVMVNSNDSTPVRVNGPFTIDAPACLDVVGPPPGLTGTNPGCVRTSLSIQADPFAGFPRPSLTGLPTVSSVSCASPRLSPGVYTDKISGNCEWVLDPGIYIFMGNGGINLVPGVGALCTGSTCSTPTSNDGVLLFFTSLNYPASGTQCGSLMHASNGTSTLIPMNSGTWKNMIIFFDPACTIPLHGPTFGFRSTLNTTGTIYVPKGAIMFGAPECYLTATQIIAKRINLRDCVITVSYTASGSASGYVPALSE